MRCLICQREFTPNKYHPSQKVCSRLECQKLRQHKNVREWRKNNPGYFKYLGQERFWKETRRRYIQLWKKTHKEHLKEYAKKRKTQRRHYMRDYMRKYRQAKKSSI